MTGTSTPLLRWRYAKYDAVRHYVNVKDGVACCGLWPDARVTPWLGNSNKTEVDILAKLPACKDCIDAVAE